MGEFGNGEDEDQRALREPLVCNIFLIAVASLCSQKEGFEGQKSTCTVCNEQANRA